MMRKIQGEALSLEVVHPDAAAIAVTSKVIWAREARKPYRFPTSRELTDS